MSLTRPFAYNIGSPISGTTQVGSLAVGDINIEYSANYGGVIWWEGSLGVQISEGPLLLFLRPLSGRFLIKNSGCKKLILTTIFTYKRE